ncbi:MAG: acylneuraminate cytidylyltransferase family protein [Pseudobutyrivibrio ruminis]|uniref:acylneuraminate cytidylyltransferase family protein n=1 Tax=Pseudobutyrivibrio ruminis TaxID=46206 RepID=UPI0026F0D64D|nr:acylneuraminate cytidylyltransferase family protein [Pseudobutyrivibrio ruminis]MBE5913599.1 acylneuraminate cytidylyltransferase family protein [Pseudobutyrivibrio ruminis]
MKKEKVVSFIPIKLNNQRFPGKNLKELSGRPLCDFIFDTICDVKGIDERYVYCSDVSIINYMKSFSDRGLMFLKRDSQLDGFQVKGLEIIERFVNDIDADIYVLTHVTQPFTKKESIENALNKVLYEGYDSAFSCVCIQDYCWYKGKTLNYDMKDIVTTQNLEPVYKETGAFFIFRKEVFTEMHQRIGSKPYLQVIDELEAVDIDTPEDFEFAKVVASYYKNGGGQI